MFDPLPSSVVLRWTHGEIQAELPAVEHAAVATATPGRRREFATTRALARQALEAASAPPVALPPSSSRAPVWPVGWTGSLTHCHGFRAALVAPTRRVQALGADAEPLTRLEPDVRDTVIDGGERHLLSWLGPWGPVTAFSAKEALFKAWHPTTRRWLDFRDASVTGVDWDLTRQRGTLELTIGTELPATWRHGACVEVSCSWSSGRVHALVVLSAYHGYVQD